MRFRSTLSLILPALVAALPAAAQMPKSFPSGPPTLKVGDPAPALQVARWVKGEPVPALAPGKVYVLEFWATWCGPCKAAIPHLTELAHRYQGRATFIGVDVMERGKSAKAMDEGVDAFVRDQGKAMDYRVCRDTPEAVMASTWLLASGSFGIPQTFVVDAKGRLAWKGHPLSLEPVLKLVLAGTFEPEAYKARHEADRQVQDAIEKAVAAERWQEVLTRLEGYAPLDGIGEVNVRTWKFRALLKTDEAKAAAFLDQVAREHPSDAVQLAWMVADAEGLSRAWYLRAAALLQAGAAGGPEGGKALALAKAKAGDTKGAAEAQQAYLAWMRTVVAKAIADAPEASREETRTSYGQMVKAEEEALARYQAGKVK